MSELFGLVVRFHLRPGQQEEFDRLVEETTAKIQQQEPGTLLYVTHVPEAAPDQRIFYELYQDRAAFESHETQPHVQHFLTERDRFILRYEVDLLSPHHLGGSLFRENSE